ncbi:tRNA-queuosine alpha-mannosyltransferase domain-containing protein [Reinekea blandensis]|uniref:tRNA-queuosine alpha-mannosyltransferase n=1 Tax=Reinekea blandensis MED297 TaxID=314283 RepID=A4BEF9_9GAMM|nr:DUF3524 domain-containing protein [Reinekea blandensis]EAR09386.1 Glycosyltransferase [Reinekea sp. MED297] [Reinekea blandensis MED297]
MNTSDQPTILLLSGYHALSQAQWCNQLVSLCPQYRWHTLALPPRYFSWRMRGAPLSFKALNNPHLHDNTDLIVATSSVDLSVTQSLYPNLRNVPSLLYFHENQFAYPRAHTPQSVIDWQMVNLYSALRADAIRFNSDYNQRTFFSGVQQLTQKLPDLVPKAWLSALKTKSAVLPVPITCPHVDRHHNKAVRTVLWNHRWEWDKQPELLEAVIAQCDAENLDIQFAITGQQFRREPQAFTTIRQQYPQRLIHLGFVDSEAAYHAMIDQCDVILSTAIHEFQGIAVMEAVARGCTPLLPDDLSYPDFFADDYLYARQETLKNTADRIVRILRHWQQQGRPPAPDMRRYAANALEADYTATIEALLT